MFPYTIATLMMEHRVSDLVSWMTLVEKVSQMVYDAPGIDRLGVAACNWWNECRVLRGGGDPLLHSQIPEKSFQLSGTHLTRIVMVHRELENQPFELR